MNVAPQSRKQRQAQQYREDLEKAARIRNWNESQAAMRQAHAQWAQTAAVDERLMALVLSTNATLLRLQQQKSEADQRKKAFADQCEGAAALARDLWTKHHNAVAASRHLAVAGSAAAAAGNDWGAKTYKTEEREALEEARHHEEGAQRQDAAARQYMSVGRAEERRVAEFAQASED